MGKKFTRLARCCGRAWLLADIQLLLILKLWFNDVISFLFDTVPIPGFHLSKTEPKTDSIYPCAWLTAYRCTRLIDTLSRFEFVIRSVNKLKTASQKTVNQSENRYG